MSNVREVGEYGPADGHSDRSDLDSSELTDDDLSWISWFCSLKGNDFFCEVDEEFIHDDFNLTGLSSLVPYYDYALDTVLDAENPNADMLSEEQQELVDAAAELLYGLIHARYIITNRGLSDMYEKYRDVDFGRCHRIYCEGQPVVPVGQSDVPRRATVGVYCPRCNDIYFPKSSRHGNIDGAYFGTTFPHLFFMTFSALVPSPPTKLYTPRVFGFKIFRGEIPADTPLPALTDSAASAAGGGGKKSKAATADGKSASAASSAVKESAGGTTPDPKVSQNSRHVTGRGVGEHEVAPVRGPNSLWKASADGTTPATPPPDVAAVTTEAAQAPAAPSPAAVTEGK